MDILSRLIYDILLVVLGFTSGFITAFSKGWVGEVFKKREDTRKAVERYMEKVTDIVAVATPAGYTIRLNNFEKRQIQRAAFQIERLGQKKLAYDIRSYLNKWSEIYEMTRATLAFKNGELPLRKDEKRRLDLIKELDKLTDSILGKLVK